MSEFNLKSGNSTPFKMMGSSPLLGCAEDPTGKGCGEIFKEKGSKLTRNIHNKIIKVKKEN